jgi:hypothetical protein
MDHIMGLSIVIQIEIGRFLCIFLEMATKHKPISTRVAYQVNLAVCNEIIERFLDRPLRFNKNKGTVVIHTDNNPECIYTLFT